MKNRYIWICCFFAFSLGCNACTKSSNSPDSLPNNMSVDTFTSTNSIPSSSTTPSSSSSIKHKLADQYTVPLSQITKDLSNVKNGQLNLDEIVVRVPDLPDAIYDLECVEEVYHTYSQGIKMNEPDLPSFYERFRKQVEYFFPETSFNSSYVHFSSYDDKPLQLAGNGYPCLTNEKVYEGMMNGKWDYNMLDYRGENVYLWCNKSKGGLPFRMNRGNLALLLGEENNVGIDTLYSFFDIEQKRLIISDDMENSSYTLQDGNCTVLDAVKFFCGSYYDSLPSQYTNHDLRWSVDEVGIFALPDNRYGYGLYAQLSYKGIPFDRRDNGHYDDSEMQSKYPSSSFGAFMLRSDNIDFWAGCYTDPQIKPIGEPITELISASGAVNIAQEQITNSVVMKALKLDLIYEQQHTLYNTVQFVNSYDPGYEVCHPVWKLTVLNTNDQTIYLFYVDAVTGKMHYIKYLEKVPY